MLNLPSRIRPPDDTPFAIESVERLPNGTVAIDATNAYGYRFAIVVPFRESTEENIRAELHRAWALRYAAEYDYQAAVYNYSIPEE